MKILLLQPRQGGGAAFKNLACVEPLGLELVAASLPRHHQVKLLELWSFDALPPALDSFKPDVVGVSCTFTVDVYLARRAAKLTKGSASKPFVMVGGHHASLTPGDFHLPYVDAVVIGEGELTAAELVQCLEEGSDLSRVDGLAINSPSGQSFTPHRKTIENLDDLPFPARHLTREQRKNYYLAFWRPMASVETARGCPYRCNYCSVWKFYEKRCRTKTPERTVEEVAAAKEDFIMFTDDNFMLNVKRGRRIAELLKERGIKKGYAFQARSDTVVKYPEVMALWKEVGLASVFIGVEAITVVLQEM